MTQATISDDGNEQATPRVVSLSSSVYLRFKDVFGDAASRRYGPRKRRIREPVAETEAYGRGRDPKGIADVMTAMTSELGWATPLAKSDLLLAWKEIAGADTAEHSFPLDVTDSVLTVQCDSTAWATQLRHMRTMIMTRIAQSYPDAGIEAVRFQAPHAPSWKKGSRSIPGRGPRDTYG
jgi:predicted nucleic acid-binding Zn ribbon protein